MKSILLKFAWFLAAIVVVVLVAELFGGGFLALIFEHYQTTQTQRIDYVTIGLVLLILAIVLPIVQSLRGRKENKIEYELKKHLEEKRKNNK